MVNKKDENAVLGCNLKNDRMIFIHFQGKPFSITVNQVYVLTIKAKQTEVEWFFEDLQDLLELMLKKDVLFIIEDRNAKVVVKSYLELLQPNTLGNKLSQKEIMDSGMKFIILAGSRQNILFRQGPQLTFVKTL